MPKTVLLTGATGYIGKRLLPLLVQQGYHVVCAVRDVLRLEILPSMQHAITVVEVDLLSVDSLDKLPQHIDFAFYLVHSMASGKEYQAMEVQSATNFRLAMDSRKVKQVIYLSGIVNDVNLSKHLSSRLAVEQNLALGNYSFTCFRAGIIIGSGSASYEIIRDLVEKLPVMVTPRWLNTKCQPIAITNVLEILMKALGNELVRNRTLDIGGPDVLTYKQMLLGYAKVRGLKRLIMTLPIMTPRLSSYWLYFVTSTSYRLAIALVDSMKVEVVCKDDEVNRLLSIQPIDYNTALEKAFAKIAQNEVLSSWKDAFTSGSIDFKVSDFINVPSFGCYKDERVKRCTNSKHTIEKVWAIGGDTGWYFANGLWRLRGFIDRLVGGVGLRRGRTNVNELSAGDAVDFWRVLYANKQEGRLLLFAEMKLPGEAWLEFRLKDDVLVQTATFRPKGLWGRMYWWLVFPFHGLIFAGLLKRLTSVN